MRLGVSLILCNLLGALTLAVTRYFSGERIFNVWIFFVLVTASLAGCLAALYLLRKPWDLERFTRQFILLIFFTYLGLTFGAFVQHFAGNAASQPTAMRALVGTLSFQGVTLLLLPPFLREHGEAFRNAFGFTVNWKMAVLFGVLAACAFMPVGELLQMASSKFLSQLNMTPEVQPAVEAMKNSSALFDRIILAVVAILLAPLGEEILFRGILYPTIKRYGFPRLALWGTSLLFAAIHVNLLTFVPLFLFAMVLGLLYQKTGNLLAPITAHAMFNVLNFVKFLIFEASMKNPG